MALFLSANICEGDDLVCIHSSRGKQCAFMSLSTALLTAPTVALTTWSKITIE